MLLQDKVTLKARAEWCLFYITICTKNREKPIFLFPSSTSMTGYEKMVIGYHGEGYKCSIIHLLFFLYLMNFKKKNLDRYYFFSRVNK